MPGAAERMPLAEQIAEGGLVAEWAMPERATVDRKHGSCQKVIRKNVPCQRRQSQKMLIAGKIHKNEGQAYNSRKDKQEWRKFMM